LISIKNVITDRRLMSCSCKQPVPNLSIQARVQNNLGYSKRPSILDSISDAYLRKARNGQTQDSFQECRERWISRFKKGKRDGSRAGEKQWMQE